MMNGKTTSADWLQNNFGYRKYSFAEDVKFAGAKMLSCFSEIIHDTPRDISVDELMRRKSEPEVRKFLQLVGSEIGKNFFHDPDVWVRRMSGKLNYEVGPVTIDDCRFPNEQEMLMQKGFMFVRLVRDDYERVLVQQYSALHANKLPEEINEMVRNAIFHPSETHINDLHADITIHATSVDELHTKLQQELGGYFFNEN